MSGNILKEDDKKTILARDVFTIDDCMSSANTFRRFADTYCPVVLWVPELVNHIRGLDSEKEDVAHGWKLAMTSKPNISL